jgi:hypothetical protein
MLKLQCSNYRSVKHPAGGALAKGVFVARATLGGALNGFVAFAALVLAQVGEIVTFAENVNATKVAGDALAFAAGEKVYYNVAGAKVSKTVTDPFIGYAKEASLAADTSINIEFDGRLGSDTFAGLADVNVTGVTNNDTLKFDTATGMWIDVAVAD